MDASNAQAEYWMHLEIGKDESLLHQILNWCEKNTILCTVKKQDSYNELELYMKGFHSFHMCLSHFSYLKFAVTKLYKCDYDTGKNKAAHLIPIFIKDKHQSLNERQIMEGCKYLTVAERILLKTIQISNQQILGLVE